VLTARAACPTPTTAQVREVPLSACADYARCLPFPPELHKRMKSLCRLGACCRPEALTNALWGDWAISPKEKRVVRIKRKGGEVSKAKPLFVQLVLETVYKVRSMHIGKQEWRSVCAQSCACVYVCMCACVCVCVRAV